MSNGTEIEKHGGSALERQEEPRSMMEVLAMAAADPRVDVQKLQALLDMQFRVEARNAEVEFNAALARLMPRLPSIEKDGVIMNKDKTSVRSRFATYERIDAVIRPLLAEEGFSISFGTDDSIPGKVRVTGTLAHRMGHSKPSTVTVPTEHSQIVGAQAVGAAVSFAKRYCVINLLNIVTVGTDTDAQPAPKSIGAEEVLALETLLQDSHADRKKFLNWARVGRLEEIQEADYPAALKALQAALRAFQAKEGK